MNQKRIFIAATQQNDGKTTVSLGLIQAFRDKFKSVGFIKPVGQRYVFEHGYKVDEDSVLIEKVCGMKGSVKDMSPIAIEKGFTEKYIKRGGHRKLVKNIISSFERISRRKDIVVIEGTGHAGVGSIFDLSNARVANLLDAKVILVTSGGIGKPIDEIELNMALFEKECVDGIGVIVNKVITPGDREDLIMTALSMHLLGKQHKQNSISGIILTGGIMPHPKIMSLIESARIPVLFSREHTYITASKIHDLAIKIRPEDKEKALIVKRLIKRYVDVNKILEKIE